MNADADGVGKLQAEESVTVSIAIPTYRRAQLLDETLRSLASHEYKSELLEILVIDNASPDDTADVVRRYEEGGVVRYIYEAEQGLDYARNRAVLEAKGDVIVFIDDDVLVRPQWLDEMVKPWKESLAGGDERIFAVGGTVIPVFPEGCPKWMDGWASTLCYDEGVLEAGKFPMGANLAFHRDAFQEVGKFSTDLDRKGDCLFSGGETEFLKRVRKAGGLVWFAPEGVLEHQFPRERMNLRYACRHSFDSARGRVYDVLKRGGKNPWGYGISRACGHFLKGMGLIFGILGCLVLGQVGWAKRSLVRLIRCWGYLHQLGAMLIFRRFW